MFSILRFKSEFSFNFHNFSENPQNRIWHYLTILSKVFALPKALILGSSFASVLGSFLDPSKSLPAEPGGLDAWPPRGSFLARRGEGRERGIGFISLISRN